MIKIHILLFFSVIVATHAGGQANGYLQQSIKQHRFEEPVWIEVTKDLDYSPLHPIRQTKKQKKSNTEKEQEERTRESAPLQVDHPVLANVVKVIILLVAAVALTLLLKHFFGFGGIPWSKKINDRQAAEIRLETIEENLHDADLRAFIQQAINQEQYALAIRLYFLAILKELSLMEAIRWKKNKTNREYIAELRNKTDFADFQKTALIFEYVWYGNRTIKAPEFQNLEVPFADFLYRLQQKNRNEK